MRTSPKIYSSLPHQRPYKLLHPLYIQEGSPHNRSCFRHLLGCNTWSPHGKGKGRPYSDNRRIRNKARRGNHPRESMSLLDMDRIGSSLRYSRSLPGSCHRLLDRCDSGRFQVDKAHRTLTKGTHVL